MQAQAPTYSLRRAPPLSSRAHLLAGTGAYLDMPIRQHGVHLSAPSIYGVALEALCLAPGLSFLNIGSGSGYFSALAARILGREGIHHGVEISPHLVAHARERLDALGDSHVQLFCASCYSLDFAHSMRYTRIYIGAGSSVGVTASVLGLLQVATRIHGARASARARARARARSRTCVWNCS